MFLYDLKPVKLYQNKTHIVDNLCVAPTLPGVVPQGYIIVGELLEEDREVRRDRRQSVVVCQEGSVEGQLKQGGAGWSAGCGTSLGKTPPDK